jgi:xylan 1,4-beta-xylosidase
MEASGLVDGYSFWTFSDIFEENYFPSLPFHGGFGLLTLHGVPKPAYRAFELMHRLGEERLTVEGVHDTVDAWVVRNDDELTVLLSNHALPRHPVRTERVKLLLMGGSPPEAARLERIDGHHANPRHQWVAWGRPDYLSQAQVEQLEEASRLAPELWPAVHTEGITRLEVDLPAHGVAAITLRLGSRREGGGGEPAHRG